MEQPAVPSFDTVYLDYSNYVECLARRLCGRSDDEADDLYQEVFLRIYRFLPAYKGGSLKAWIRRITVNSYYSSLRCRREDLLVDGDPHFLNLPDPGVSTSGAVVRRQQRKKVDLAISNLPKEGRHVLVLRDYEELEYQEIADRLNIPVGTVRSRLNRARQALRRVLQD